MEADVAARTAPRRLIFTVTTGRSGTRHLAFCLGSFRDVEARHEPRPKFSDALRSALADPAAARTFWREQKLPVIARTRRPIYAETSHVACKAFLDALVETGARPSLVHLRREPRAVACSLLALATVPGRTRRGRKYYLGPDDPNHLPVDVPADAHDYQLCYWYALETERRAAFWAERARELDLRFVSLELARLQDFAGVRDLGAALDLGPLRPAAALRFRVLGTRHRNRKADKKAPTSLTSEELERLEAEVHAWVGGARAAPRGEPVPGPMEE